MSLTRAIHTRFWKSMGERFGKRWLDEYGDTPTKSWTTMLDRFSPDDLSGALAKLKDRQEHSRAHPPTHAEFESLLTSVARANHKAEVNYRRGYWRSLIVAAVSGGMQGRGLIVSGSEFEGFLIQHKSTLGTRMRELLDELETMELNTGQRTFGMEQHAARRAHEIAMGWNPRPQLEIVR